MNNNITLVTALYYSEPTSRMGGRGYCLEFYKAPFRNILSLDLPLVIYTDNKKNQATLLKEYLDSENFTKYKIIFDDLDSFRLSDRIYELKEKEGVIDKKGLVEGRHVYDNQRSTHLCLKKMFWLRDQIKENPYNSSKFFWIDFGLFHNSLFPDSLGGMEKCVKVIPEKYWPLNKNNIFNPSLFDKVCNFTQDKFFCINYNKQNCINHLVGGLLGGNRDVVEKVCNEFEKEMDRVYAEGIRMLEEPIISIVRENIPELFNTLYFEEWFHDAPGRDADMIQMAHAKNKKCFYQIFTKDI